MKLIQRSFMIEAPLDRRLGLLAVAKQLNKSELVNKAVTQLVEAELAADKAISDFVQKVETIEASLESPVAS